MFVVWADFSRLRIVLLLMTVIAVVVLLVTAFLK
jgi:hypothetical protein